MTTEPELEARARRRITRALDAVAVDPAPVAHLAAAVRGRAGRRDGWEVAAALAVAAAAFAVAVVLPADGGGETLATDGGGLGAAECGAVAGVIDGVLADGSLPNGEAWRVEVVGAPPDLALWVVGVSTNMQLVEDAWPGPAPLEPPVWATPVPGGFVVAAELPADAVATAIDTRGGTVTTCARSIETTGDVVRFAAAFVAAEHDDIPTLRALAADGTLLATATWMSGEPTGMVVLAPIGMFWADQHATTTIPPERVDDPVATVDTAGTTFPTVSVPPDEPRGPRPPVPANEAAHCGEEPPPFTFNLLPEGIDPTPVHYRDWRIANTPPGQEGGWELYDPIWLMLDPADPDRRIALYHGNSWRLANELREELTVLGHPAWLSDNIAGTVIIDFQVTGSGDPCDYWAIGNVGFGEDELRAVAAGLATD